MKDGYDVVVVGAGAVGAAAALEASRRGASVLVVDRAERASGATARGSGLVCHVSWDPLNVGIIQRSARAFEELNQEAEARGDPFRFTRTGSTTLVAEEHRKRIEELARIQRAAGADVRVLEIEEARDLPGHAGVNLEDVAAAAHCPEDGWAVPSHYTHLALALSGADVSEGVAAGLADGGILVGGRFVRAGATVLAAGVWTSALAPAAQLAYRTQAARFTGEGAGDVPILHDTLRGFYLRPDVNGGLVAGNGTTTTPEDPENYRRDADADFPGGLLARLRHRFPAYALACERAWAGVDAATPDRHPLLGPLPGREDVVLATGTNGFGFMRAPALGECAAALAVRDRPPLDVSAFDPARFRGRESDPFQIREGFTL